MNEKRQPQSISQIVEEIATGFETFDSFYAGLTRAEERDSERLYELYLTDYIRATLQTYGDAREAAERERISREVGRRIDEWADGEFHTNIAGGALCALKGLRDILTPPPQPDNHTDV